MDAIENTVKQFIGDYISADCGVTEIDDIRTDMSIVDDLGLDSLSTVELIMDLEEEFSIVANNNEIYACKVVKDVIDLVKEKIDGIQGT